MTNIQTTSNNPVNSTTDAKSTPANKPFHSTMVEGLVQLGKTYQELAVVTQENAIFDSENTWDFEKDAFDHKGAAADSALKASKIKAGLSIGGGLISVGGSFGGSIAGKGIGSKERTARKEVMSTADGMSDAYEREAFLNKNRDVLEPHRKLELMGRNSQAVGSLFDSIGEAGSSGVSAEVTRENNAADLDKTMSSISSGDQRTSTDAAKQVTEGLRSFKQMLASMQGKMSDAMAVK